jgi:hypothetical protein
MARLSSAWFDSATWMSWVWEGLHLPHVSSTQLNSTCLEDKNCAVELELQIFSEKHKIGKIKGIDHLTEFHLIEIVFFQLIESFIISWSNFFRLSTWSKNLINCQKRTYGFWQSIKILIMSFWVILNFRSSAKK